METMLNDEPILVEVIDLTKDLQVLLLEQKAVAFSLTDVETTILKEIIAISPKSIEDINNGFLEIIKDGKIDAKDILPFVQIMKEIYLLSHQELNIKVKDLVDVIGSILKYILHVILVKNNMVSPDLLKSIQNIIDMVVEMIKFNPINKSKNCFFKLC